MDVSMSRFTLDADAAALSAALLVAIASATDGNVSITVGSETITAAVTASNTDAQNATAITTAFSAYGIAAAADDTLSSGADGQGIKFTFTEVAAVTGVDAVAEVTEVAANVNRISVEATTTDGTDAADNARAGIVLIDAAIKEVNIQRSQLGAVSNRLNHTVNNLTNISSNLSAAKGGIEDADFALETTNLAKNQILQQASTAMLAQANASKQNVLSLLQ